MQDADPEDTSEQVNADLSESTTALETSLAKVSLESDPTNVADVLGNDGPFAAAKPGFQARAEQQQLATEIDRCIVEQNILVAEAGTGVGKTFAYLVPALTCGKRVIISTGTRHLQDQLFHTDLPVVRRVLRVSPKVALLKGRANYLCKRRLEKAMHNPALRDPSMAAQLNLIRDWARQTKTGDIAEVLDVPEASPIWGYVTSSDDVCRDHEVDDIPGCFVHKARKRAMDATVVVVNHHLFCADLSLKEGSFGEILPDTEVMIIDEAHQLPETAAMFFGKRISSRQLLDLARDSHDEYLAEAPDVSEIRDRAAALEKATRDFRLSLGLEPRREAWVKVYEEAGVSGALDTLREALELLYEPLDIAASRGKGLESCRRRCLAHLEVLESFGDNKDEQYIHWFETFRTGFGLTLTPQNVAQAFSSSLSALNCSWVFTSATLAVKGSFEHFENQLGIEDANELQVDSPFDYKKNAMLYLPANMPEPQNSMYDESVLSVAEHVINASGGRCFVLFTSYRALEAAAAFMRANCTYPVLVQGQMPKRELVESFQSIGNAVLLGTASFWEGVDVRGEALSCVIIDKLPFASPGDPVLQARIQGMQQNGINAFSEFQLPKAVLTLKQGVGRLIRDVNDRGVLVICDPRLQSKSYGQTFLDSLPAMRIVQKPASVENFFKEEPA